MSHLVVRLPTVTAMASPSKKSLPPKPSGTADSPQLWSFLAPGIDLIMTKQQTGASFSQYAFLYTVVYNCCTSSKFGGELAPEDLYVELAHHLVGHLKPRVRKAKTLQDDALLRYHTAEWECYSAGASCLDRIFTPLNRGYVKWCRKSVQGVYKVYTLALAQWRRHLLAPLQLPLISAILETIAAQCKGAQIDEELVKKVVDSFVSLGMDAEDPKNEGLDVYKELFAVPLLAQYAPEAFMTRDESNASIYEYLKKVERRHREEDGVVPNLFADWADIQDPAPRESAAADTSAADAGRVPPNVSPPILFRLLIPIRLQALLDLEVEEDLQRMYTFLARIPGAVESLWKPFKVDITAAGRDAISRLVKDAVGPLDPRAYLDALLGVRGKYTTTILRCFKAEADFVAALDDACRKFVNRNAATGTSAKRSPELLATYADTLLRKSNQGQIVLFNYLEDKDVFLTFYTLKLSQRLIHGVSASDEAETRMISKFKRPCGDEYTNKLQRMFTDITISEDLTDSFKTQNRGNIDLAFKIMILGTRRPTTSSSHLSYSPPLIQAAVLLQFNCNDSLSLRQLLEATKLSQKILVQVLAPLVGAKVLVKQGKKQYKLNLGVLPLASPSCLFSSGLSTELAFKLEKLRVNLNRPLKAEKKEEVAVLKAVDEDRKYVVQATIVRILKARKTMKIQVLIQEVISQISQRFAPKILDIKKAIEVLIEQEYIERSGGSRDSVAYVA
ncbi:Cullin family-domain-containing protein [Mycena galopus ATCC 62051]|nr:Cullin family-domain-containing protein [Mycena galopus ATCC 62051]